MEDDSLKDVIPEEWAAAESPHSTSTSAFSVTFPGEAIIAKKRGSYEAFVTVEKGHIIFVFKEVAFTKQSVECVLTISPKLSSGYQQPFTQRIDLRSASARKGLASDLNAAYGDKKMGLNWALLLNTAFNGIIDEIQGEQQPISVEDIPYEDVPFMAPPFLQTGVPNILFAQSEAGKTWFALRLAISLVHGGDFLGYPIVGGKKILFLDYEDSMRVFTNRLYNLSAGMNLPFKEIARGIHYYKPVGSFRSNVEHLKTMVLEKGYDLIILDAGGDAAGGSPSDEEKVLDLFNAMEEIPATKLVLHHEPKYVVSEQAAFYGSMYWKARSRVAWRLQVESEDSGRKLIKASIQKRSNLGYQEPFFYHLTFDNLTLFSDAEAPVTLSVRMDKVNPEDIKRDKPLDEAIVEALEKYGEMSSQQLAEAVGRERSVVQKALKSLTQMVEQKKSGKSFVWKLKNL